jgi:hypothetical protein
MVDGPAWKGREGGRELLLRKKTVGNRLDTRKDERSKKQQ